MRFLKFPNFLGFRSPEMFIASAPVINKLRINNDNNLKRKKLAENK